MKDSENQSVAKAERKPREAQRKPEPSVNMDELRELIALLRENGLAEFELEREGFRVRLRRGAEYEGTGMQVAPPVQTSAPAPRTTTPASSSPSPSHPGALAETAASEDHGLHIIESPIVGTFYRSRSPNAEPFVKTGSNVEPGSTVCIIEAMKLMNEITAETSGEVVKIYVENGQPVEYGQPLFGIKN
jgi:acetyl-CoA carboxylase biotin carboxyl carrier protein